MRGGASECRSRRPRRAGFQWKPAEAVGRRRKPQTEGRQAFPEVEEPAVTAAVGADSRPPGGGGRGRISHVSDPPGAIFARRETEEGCA